MKLLGIFGIDALLNAGAGLVFYFSLLILIQIISFWKIFEKAGEPGWASLIPIYRTIVYLKIIGKSTVWLLLFIIPFINIIFIIMSLNLLSKSFGKDESFTFGLIILHPIFILILAFGSSDYIGPVGNEDFRRSMYQNNTNPAPINVTVNTPVNIPNQPQPTHEAEKIQSKIVTDTSSKLKFCTNCGAKINNPNVSFCVNCGAKL